MVGTITGDHENRITDYTNLIVFNKKRRAQSSEDFETWVQGGAANTLNTFDNSDVRATTVIIEGGCWATGNGQTNTTDLSDKVGALDCMHDQKIVVYAIDRAAFNQGENAQYKPQIDEGGWRTQLSPADQEQSATKENK